MNNYQQFKTLSKTPSCSFYEAYDRNLSRKVLLKRIPQKQSWDQLLSNNNFIFSQKLTIFTKMIEVFKYKKYFFIAYQKTAGPPLSQPSEVGKLQIAQFFMVFSDLCQSISILRSKIPNAYVQPQWIFLNRNQCKIGHFEPYYSQQNDAHGHVYMYNLQKAIQKQQEQKNNLNPELLDKSTNLTYSLGCIAYQLLTGKKAVQAQNLEQYEEKSQLFRVMCQKRIMKATNHEKLSQFIGKMVCKNSLQLPTFEQIKNFSARYCQQYNFKKKQPLAVQVQLEKIKLQRITEANNVAKKLLRPCCKAVKDKKRKQHKHQKKIFYLNTSEFLAKSSKQRSLTKVKTILPNIRSKSHKHQLSLTKSMNTQKVQPTISLRPRSIASQY